ncbi:hypothetical protein VTJ49DRAFT_5211 [Mycothermus thermophilus]|uniref:Ecp2 effector protein domain-containing protein n=1 Tax=Humicola insolens TaxID=85995 RepID=A0ABR3VKP9_HUMIN
MLSNIILQALLFTAPLIGVVSAAPGAGMPKNVDSNNTSDSLSSRGILKPRFDAFCYDDAYKGTYAAAEATLAWLNAQGRAYCTPAPDGAEGAGEYYHTSKLIGRLDSTYVYMFNNKQTDWARSYCADVGLGVKWIMDNCRQGDHPDCKEGGDLRKCPVGGVQAANGNGELLVIVRNRE